VPSQGDTLPGMRSRASATTRTAVPEGVQDLLGRLFGVASREARRVERNPDEWKATLRRIVLELDLYLQENVATDAAHAELIRKCMESALRSLDLDDFWPGLAGGLMMLAFVLMGDPPDHRRRRGGRKTPRHYQLTVHRSLAYARTSEQRFRTLLAAKRSGAQLSRNPLELWWEFRRREGPGTTKHKFLQWYRQRHPADYAEVF
jgi:hypothetical protein